MFHPLPENHSRTIHSPFSHINDPVILWTVCLEWLNLHFIARRRRLIVFPGHFRPSDRNIERVAVEAGAAAPEAVDKEIRVAQSPILSSHQQHQSFSSSRIGGCTSNENGS